MGVIAVVMIAAGVGAPVTLAGVVGRDEPGKRLQDLLKSHEIEPHLWIDDRPTTWKQRIVTRGHLRPDRCDCEVTTPIGHKVADYLADVPIGDTLLIQDYGKGVCTERFLSRLLRCALAERVPVLVDPVRSRKWSDYGGVTLIKANWVEATQQSGSTNMLPRQLARRLSDMHDCHVVITLGERGLVCAERDGEAWGLPAKRVGVRDVCGAGDTVLATLGVAIARGESLHDSCVLAAAMAADQVARVGVFPVRWAA